MLIGANKGFDPIFVSAQKRPAGERDAEDVSSLILRRVEERGKSLEGEGDMGGSRGTGARPGSDGDSVHVLRSRAGTLLEGIVLLALLDITLLLYQSCLITFGVMTRVYHY